MVPLAILTGNAEDRQHQKESVQCNMGPDEKEKQGSKVTCDCQWHDGGVTFVMNKVPH